MTFAETIETVGKVVDATGVAVIVVGALVATWATLVHRRPGVDPYHAFRRRLGRSILLGLEFLVAADIIRTVAVTPTPRSVAVLGAIVLIRTFLSFALQLEMTGAWPWQRTRTDEGPAPRGSDTL